MRDLGKLNEQLLNSEFEVAQQIYGNAIRNGYGPVKAAALAYRHGVLDGREKEQSKTKEAYKRFNGLKERLHVLESSRAMTQTLADLINNPMPNRELPDTDATNSPTPGEKQEAESNE